MGTRDRCTLLVINSTTKERLTWHDVQIQQIPFVFPPLYTITLPSGSTYWFNTENKYTFFSFGPVVDLSGMGRLIRQKAKDND